VSVLGLVVEGFVSLPKRGLEGDVCGDFGFALLPLPNRGFEPCVGAEGLRALGFEVGGFLLEDEDRGFEEDDLRLLKLEDDRLLLRRCAAASSRTEDVTNNRHVKTANNFHLLILSSMFAPSSKNPFYSMRRSVNYGTTSLQGHFLKPKSNFWKENFCWWFGDFELKYTPISMDGLQDDEYVTYTKCKHLAAFF